MASRAPNSGDISVVLEQKIAVLPLLGEVDHYTLAALNHCLRCICEDNDQNFKDILFHKGLKLQALTLVDIFGTYVAICCFGWWHQVSQLISHEVQRKIAAEILEEMGRNNDFEKILLDLMEGCSNRDEGRIKSILLHLQMIEKDISADEKQWECLRNALAEAKQLFLKDFFEAGFEVLQMDLSREVLLLLSCMFGQSHKIREILQNCNETLDPCRPYQIGLMNKSPFDCVAEGGHVETLEVLLRSQYRPTSGFVPNAAYNGRLELVEICIVYFGFDVDEVDAFGRTALHRAICSKKTDKKELMIKLLLNHGASLATLTGSSQNILHVVADSGCPTDIAVMFLEVLKEKRLLSNMINQKDRYSGVDMCYLIRGRDKGRDAWHYVEVKRPMVNNFLDKSKKGNVDVTEFGTVIHSGWGTAPTPSDVAQVTDMFKQRMGDSGSVPDMTPLHVASLRGNIDIAQILKDNGADPAEKDKFGLTPGEIVQPDYNLQLHQDESNSLHVINATDFHRVIQIFTQTKMVPYTDILRRMLISKDGRNFKENKTEVVDLLRDLTVQITQCLTDIGSGPIASPVEINT